MIIIFGNVGSGKGTQAQLLAEKLNCPTISTGQLLRDSTDSKIKALLNSGKLLSDEVIYPVLEQKLRDIGAAKNEFILEGFPRKISQVKWLVEKIKAGELRFTAALRLNLSQATALERLRLRGRHDDTPEAIKQRFVEYEASVVPAIDYLKSQGFEFIEIDGNKSVEEVSADIQKATTNK